MRIIPIECIPNDSCLGKTIYDSDGRVLLKSGTKLTSIILRKVKQLGIYSLYIEDEFSSNVLEDVIKPELRQKAVSALKGTFNNISRFNSSHKASVGTDDFKYFASIHSIAKQILDNLLNSDNILVSLIDIKNLDSYTYQHSVNVAVLSLTLGIGLKLPQKDLLDLCIGALLHDIGKVFIPLEILNKPGKLTNEEFSLIKKHTEKGYDYLYKYYDLHTASKLIVLQHHEAINGLGYPEGIKGDKISSLAKIVSIVDVYDALTSDRPYRRALCANDALEYIMANSGTKFDYDLVKMFTKLVIPFPPGTLVRLSNGDLAITEDTPVNFPLRPNLKILESSNPELKGKKFKLVDNFSVVINSIEYNLN